MYNYHNPIVPKIYKLYIINKRFTYFLAKSD